MSYISNLTAISTNKSKNIMEETCNLRNKNIMIKIKKIIKEIRVMLSKIYKRTLVRQRDQLSNKLLAIRSTKMTKNKTKHQHSVGNLFRGQDQETRMRFNKLIDPFKCKRVEDVMTKREEIYQSE